MSCAGCASTFVCRSATTKARPHHPARWRCWSSSRPPLAGSSVSTELLQCRTTTALILGGRTEQTSSTTSDCPGPSAARAGGLVIQPGVGRNCTVSDQTAWTGNAYSSGVIRTSAARPSSTRRTVFEWRRHLPDSMPGHPPGERRPAQSFSGNSPGDEEGVPRVATPRTTDFVCAAKLPTLSGTGLMKKTVSLNGPAAPASAGQHEAAPVGRGTPQGLDPAKQGR